jgi:D-inositol-3-phosphate glycosyltransferase
VIGEEQVVAAADTLIANTVDEAKDLLNHYDADPSRIEVIHPGVDLDAFRPTSTQAARERLGIAPDVDLLLFVGRIQPLKAPDVLLRAAAELIARDPARRRRLQVAVVGGPSGTGLEHPTALAELATALGIADLVQFVPPVGRAELADWYAAASVVCVPSYNESFGLVAVEAQAVGTPVVAAAVGGLTTAVAHGESGFLVEGHDPADYATVIARVIDQPALRTALSAGAVQHAAEFSWDRTAAETLSVYERARARLRLEVTR